MSERTAKRIIPWIAGALLAGLVLVVAVAGNLEPPGAPAPTMKTLTEVEPCVPIHASDLPLTIATPGSYCLAENISTTEGGITISTSNVTIDLRGLVLDGLVLNGGTGLDGISATSGTSGIQIKNGTITGWSGNGINLGLVSGATISNVQAVANNNGIRTGARGLTDGCVADGNVNIGIVADGPAVISRCSATGSSIGFKGSNGTTIVDSVATENTKGFVFGGLGFGSGGTISRCRALNNGFRGIEVTGSYVFDSTAFGNGGDGIVSFGDSVLRHNSTVLNGGGATGGAGIHVVSLNTTVDENDVSGNVRGIKVDNPGNIIIRNIARGSSTPPNYDIVASNDVGPIGHAATSASPWANIDPDIP